MLEGVARSIPGVSAAGDAIAKELSRITTIPAAKEKLRRDYAGRSDRDKKIVNEENDYAIIKVRVYGRMDLVTVIGNIASPTPGEILSMSEEWINHPQFGDQFKVTFCKSSVPATVVGIQKYLGGGLIQRHRACNGQTYSFRIRR